MLRVCGKGFVRSFSPIVSYKGKIHVTFWCQKWDYFPLFFFLVHITQTQRRNTSILGVSIAEKSFDYKSWSLEELRAEARKQFIPFTQKDGVKTLISKLRTHDRLMSEKEPNMEDYKETPDKEKASDLTFDQRLQLLQLERQIRIEEREAEREKRNMKDKLKERDENTRDRKHGRKKKG